jgi:dTDP-4-amino-4,6-dideoxygalactose transaminase
MNKIACLNLDAQHQQIKEEVFELLGKVYDAAAFSGGPFVTQFEEEFAAYCNTSYAIGLSNGTAALHLAMLALGIGIGDEVIIPANTYIATAWGVSHTGATPVFVDCTSDTWEIDVTKIEEKITVRTKAIIGVHLYGQPFDVDAIKAICDKHNLLLVEDAAQAHGARYKGKPVGSFGELGCFSFYPSKNLGACGEAGGITTNNEHYVKPIQLLRNQGALERYYHNEIGYNYRMGGFEAASLIVKLKYLDQWNNRRRTIASRYLTEIKNQKLKLQHQPEWAISVFHLFVVTTDNRAAFCNHLEENNIIPAFHYPIPCHLQKAYAHLGYRQGDLPNAEYLAAHCVSLPMFAELTEDQVDHVIDVINTY